MLWNLRTAARPEPGHGASEAGASGRPRIGIAFGSGAARGWSHIGVIQRLQDAGLEPDVVTGTSVGALVGGCHVAGCLDALEDFARGLTKRRVFGLLDVAWRGGGVISGDKLSDLLRQEVGDTRIENLPRRFACVATELATGHEIWLQRGRLVDAMRASYALPGVFKPVFLHSRWLIDGAVVDPIPVSVCRALGARLVIAVNLNSDVYSAGTIIQAPHRDSEDGRPDPARRARPATPRCASCSAGRRRGRDSRAFWSPPSTSPRTASPARGLPAIRPTSSSPRAGATSDCSISTRPTRASASDARRPNAHSPSSRKRLRCCAEARAADVCRARTRSFPQARNDRWRPKKGP